jgi:hypothetical protein
MWGYKRQIKYLKDDVSLLQLQFNALQSRYLKLEQELTMQTTVDVKTTTASYVYGNLCAMRVPEAIALILKHLGLKLNFQPSVKELVEEVGE